MTRKRRRLTDEERTLWSRVARTTVPLKGKELPEVEPKPLDDMMEDVPLQKPVTRTMPHEARAPAKTRPRAPRRLDAPTQQKLARGRLPIAGRVDLHGLTQDRAHSLLLSVLSRAYKEERRYVLVITGKGSREDSGVLRRTVPQWLSTAPFRALVSGYEEAARHHGGAGALYVRLRRRRS
ncbi:Smr/MutS family protein [Chelativorans sp. YIM 93263]|uniref:Smr/MutS family protein n=1 Tax=Chelativorans sp. YIM 93263 TaxID=2906648 RepID=UPI002377EFBC|nr:Smr/MutS family protein [Chelativorans sp. YIM 93263]